VVMDRKVHPKEGSYTNYLFVHILAVIILKWQRDIPCCLKKLGDA